MLLPAMDREPHTQLLVLFSPAVAQTNGFVKYGSLYCVVVSVGDKVTLAFKLKNALWLGIAKRRLCYTLSVLDKRLGIDCRQKSIVPLAFLLWCFGAKQPVVFTHGDVYALTG